MILRGGGPEIRDRAEEPHRFGSAVTQAPVVNRFWDEAAPLNRLFRRHSPRSAGKRYRSHTLLLSREAVAQTRPDGSRLASRILSGGGGYSTKLDPANADAGGGPAGGRRRRLSCLLLGLEQNDREALAVGTFKPIAGNKARGRADDWQDVVYECVSRSERRT